MEIQEEVLLLDIGDTLVHITEPFEIYTKRAISNVYDKLKPPVSKVQFVEEVFQYRTEIRKEAHKLLQEKSIHTFLRDVARSYDLAELPKEELDALEAAYISAELEITSLYEDSTEFLRNAVDKGRYVVAASNNFSIAHVYAVLDKFGLRPLFQTCFISAEIGWRKPAQEFFGHIHQALGCDRESMIMIGDKLSADISGASEAGLKVLWLNRTSHKQEAPSEFPSVSTLRDVRLP